MTSYPEEQISDAGHDFFGPGTDLAISLVAVLILVIAAQRKDHGDKVLAQTLKHEEQTQEQKAVDEKKVNMTLLVDQQHELMSRLATELQSGLQDEGQEVYRIPIGPPACTAANDRVCAVTVRHQLAKQRILLGESVLFAEDRYEINPQGRRVLEIIAHVLKERLSSIQEIHIEGHADTQRSNRFESNLELAGWRAMAVFKTLVGADRHRSPGNDQLNPVDTIISVASLGEYVPLDRDYDATEFSEEMLKQANDTEDELRRNRRVEVSLIYRWPVESPSDRASQRP